MKAYEVIGYTYNAGIHCLGCAVQAGMDWDDMLDDDDNPPHPVFAGDEGVEDESCEDCGGSLC